MGRRWKRLCKRMVLVAPQREATTSVNQPNNAANMDERAEHFTVHTTRRDFYHIKANSK